MVELLDNAVIDGAESAIYFHVDDPLKDVTQVPSRLHKTLLLNLRASKDANDLFSKPSKRKPSF